MPTFDSKTYVRPGQKPPRSVQINRRIAKRPVLLFGIPFIGIVFAGAYVLSKTQNVRFERRDSKVKLVSEEDALGLEHGRRKVNAREEYYRLQSKGLEDLDEWENKRSGRQGPPSSRGVNHAELTICRIERLPGQADNVMAPNAELLDPARK